MTIWQSIVFGAVQGLTEFLPVSSSGHLVLLEKLFHIAEPSLLFRVLLHVGTACAVIVACFPEFWSFVKKPKSKLNFYFSIAVFATGSIGMVADLFFEDLVMGKFVSYGFLITAVFLLLVQLLVKKKDDNVPFTGTISPEAEGMKFSQCLAMGIAQGIAVLPGISRSGATVCTGVTMGMDRERAARFSFLVSVPVIFGSCIFELAKEWRTIGVVDIWPAIAGFITAFVFGFLAIKFMMKIVSKSMYLPFSVYLVGIAIFSFFL